MTLKSLSLIFLASLLLCPLSVRGQTSRPLSAPAPTTVAKTLPSSRPADRLFVCDRPKFSLRIPAGFEEIKGRETASRLAVFRMSGQRPGDEIYLVIERLSIEEMRRTLRKEDLGPHVQAVYTETWKGQPVNSLKIVTPGETGNEIAVTRNTIVPLKDHAIVLQLGGPQEKDAQMAAMVPTLLSGLDGSSSRDEPRFLGMKSDVAPYLMVIGIVILLVVFKRYQYLQRKKEQAQASTLEDPSHAGNTE